MSRLLSNKKNLLITLQEFINSHEEQTIYSAYIKSNFLRNLLEQVDHNITTIIVRWDGQDLINGASDLEVYDVCKEYGIQLFRNKNLHAKCIVAKNGDCILGSANFTSRGMQNKKNSNWEVNTSVKQIDLESRIILDRIKQESHIVTADWVDQLHDMLSMKNVLRDDINLIDPPNLDKDFLITSLPMCSDPTLLYEVYSKEREVNQEEVNAVSHDLALYGILENHLNIESFMSDLEFNFKSHPFIESFLNRLEDDKVMRYGAVVRWIQDNCTEVPAPRSWELKQRLIVNILTSWLTYFYDNIIVTKKYPRGSDIIEFKNNSA